MSRFESSFGGDASRIEDSAILECGVCWWIYDPSQGDDVWQIPAGTSFAALPDHWRCPNCDTPREQFMVIGSSDFGSHDDHQRPAEPAGRAELRAMEDRLAQAYHCVDERMRSLPVHNDRLRVEVIGLRRCEEGTIGIVATPWCMNLLLLPREGSKRRVEGSKRDVTFPSGRYEFIAGHLDGIGPTEACSLFSPMDEFDDPEVVADVARHAIRALFIDPEAAEAAAGEPENDEPQDAGRRSFLTAGMETSR